MNNNCTQLKFSSDLMQNFKALHPASVEKNMQAVCNHGCKAFLSISDDGRLYVTAEQELSDAGWERKDISAEICSSYASDVQVTNFSINANRDDAASVLAVVLSSEGKQYIYISANDSVTDPVWVPVALPEEIQMLSFYNITVSSYKGKISIMAYYKTQNGSIERYSIVSADGTYNKWIYSPLPADFDEIMETKSGRASYSRVDGTYTLGRKGADCQLLFTPAYNYYNPELSPTSSRLTLLQKADAIAVIPSRSKADATDVFVCGDGSLYWFSGENQDDGAEPVMVAQSPYFYDVKQLYSFESKGRVYIWVLNESKELCYLFVNREEVANPQAWSVVAVLKEELDYVYPFCEKDTNAMYGYTKDGKGILGYESEETGLWSYVTVFISRKSKQAVPINSYVTLIKTPQPCQIVSIAVDGNRVVDINGGIYSFKGNVVRVKSTASCDVRITELTESVYAAKFRAWIEDEETKEYDPGRDVEEKLFALGDGDKLYNAVITSQTGETEYLVPRDTSRQSVDAVASAINTLDRARKDIDGITAENEVRQGIRLKFANGEVSHENFSYNQDGVLLDMEAFRSSCAVYSSEDTFGYLRSLCGYKSVENGFFDVVIDFIDGAWNFIVRTAEKIISFVVDCVEKAVSCVVEIFNTIKIAAEKVIKFLKYVFDMGEILLVKDVIEKIMNVSKEDMKKELQEMKSTVKEAFEEIDKRILEWGDIQNIGDIGGKSMQNIQNESEFTQHANDVHANYLTNTIVENQETASVVLQCPRELADYASGEIDRVIEELSVLYEREKETAERLIKRMQNEFFGDESITDMDILTLLRKLSALIASAAVEGVSAVVEVLFDLVIYILDIFFELLNTDIYIPCVSEFLELCGIGTFSFMDVICFIPAFAGTVIYKLIMQKTLISKELHDRIMEIHSLSELKNVTAAMGNDSFNKGLFLSFKIVSAVATFAECVFAGIDFSIEGKSTTISVLAVGMAAIDGGFYVANSFFVYELLDKKLPDIPKTILTVVKYLPFICKAMSLYQKIIRKDEEKAKYLDKVFGTLYAMTSVIAIAGNITYIVEAAQLKNVDSTEKKAYILDEVSLIPDNLRNVMDGVLRYVKPEQGVPFWIIIAVRTVCGVSYGSLQIVEGGIV